MATINPASITSKIAFLEDPDGVRVPFVSIQSKGNGVYTLQADVQTYPKEGTWSVKTTDIEADKLKNTLGQAIDSLTLLTTQTFVDPSNPPIVAERFGEFVFGKDIDRADGINNSNIINAAIASIDTSVTPTSTLLLPYQKELRCLPDVDYDNEPSRDILIRSIYCNKEGMTLDVNDSTLYPESIIHYAQNGDVYLPGLISLQAANVTIRNGTFDGDTDGHTFQYSFGPKVSEGWITHHQAIGSRGRFDNLLVEDMKIYSFKGELLYQPSANATGVICRRCELGDTNGSIVSIGGNMTIENCRIYNGHNAVENVIGSGDITITDCTLEDTGKWAIAIPGNYSPPTFTGSSRLVMRGNTITGCVGGILLNDQYPSEDRGELPVDALVFEGNTVRNCNFQTSAFFNLSFVRGATISNNEMYASSRTFGPICSAAFPRAVITIEDNTVDSLADDEGYFNSFFLATGNLTQVNASRNSIKTIFLTDYATGVHIDPSGRELDDTIYIPNVDPSNTLTILNNDLRSKNEYYSSEEINTSSSSTFSIKFIYGHHYVRIRQALANAGTIADITTLDHTKIPPSGYAYLRGDTISQPRGGYGYARLVANTPDSHQLTEDAYFSDDSDSLTLQKNGDGILVEISRTGCSAP